MSSKHGKMLYIKFSLFCFCLYLLKTSSVFGINHKSNWSCEAISTELYKKMNKDKENESVVTG